MAAVVGLQPFLLQRGVDRSSLVDKRASVLVKEGSDAVKVEEFVVADEANARFLLFCSSHKEKRGRKAQSHQALILVRYKALELYVIESGGTECVSQAIELKFARWVGGM